MQKVLITGFEPFGGERLNPSWEVVKQLNDMELVGTRIVARQLPCVFGAALDALNAAIDEGAAGNGAGYRPGRRPYQHHD